MARVVTLAAGTLLTVAGVLFGLQGLGVIHGSAMSGKSTWAILGPIMAGFGVALLLRGLRRTR